MSDLVAYPVQVLREHLTGLEAAMAVCLADPDHKPVHKLRTETRRVEALLTLLDLIPDLPEHRKEAAAALRALAKLRRAAGKVRDLDVHRKMLEGFAVKAEGEIDSRAGDSRPTETTVEPKKSAKKKEKKDGAIASPQGTDTALEAAALLGKYALELREHLESDRHKAASALVALLKKRQIKTAKTTEELLEVLASAENVTLSAAELLRDAEAVLTRDGLPGSKPLADLRHHDLHTIRKSAKRARYIAESLPDHPELAAATRRYEAMQDAGGQWHDALEIARAARRHFGKGHELTVAYREQREQKLAVYRSALSSITKPSKKPAKSAPNEAKKSESRAGKPGAKKVSKAA